jgi:hypothetical protein
LLRAFRAAAEPSHCRAARYAWALLLARIYEVFPLRYPDPLGARWVSPFPDRSLSGEANGGSGSKVAIDCFVGGLIRGSRFLPARH